MISRYDAYNDSGVEWIGEIPEHWEVRKLKNFAKICNGKDYQNISLEEGGYPVYGTGGEFARCAKFLYNEPSVLLGRKGTIDNPLIVTEPFWTSDTMYYTEINDDVIPKFFFYLVKQINFDKYRYGSAVPSMTKSVYDEMFFPYCQLSEQTQIVSYLDEKTALIDKLISTKQRKIELLKEKRPALINHAVTKGLNPNVKMKDSGIEWIGEIPEHWGYKKTTHCFGLIGSGTTPTSNNPEYYEDGEINWLQTGDLNDGIISKTSKLITQKAFDDVNLKLYPANSLIIAMYGATIGKVGFLKIETTTNQACCVLAQPRGVFVNYIFYWFISNKDKIVSLAYGGGQPNISQETIKSLRIHCPPIPEQTQIVTYLDEKTKEIDDLLNIEQKKIDLLKEYRQSLISEVVTGKIKVVNELLNEFDED